ncbi:MAG: hypothetical protein HY832_02615 [Candidatus Aenigmarchaeota archaeon]|nr:hypothetical protein [Candidatus Aenigmarchaeota archaeon]
MKMGKKLFFGFILMLSSLTFADSDHIEFPEWTYWTEIAEHMMMLGIAVIAIILLLNCYKNQKIKNPIKFAMIGFGIFAFGEFSTIFHHFLVYPFGVWNAIINHGLLLIAIAVILYGFLELLKEKQKKTNSSA